MRKVFFTISFMFVCGSCLFFNESNPVICLSVMCVCVCVCVCFSADGVFTSRGGGARRQTVCLCFLSGRSHSEHLRDVKLKDQRSCHSSQEHTPTPSQSARSLEVSLVCSGEV